MENKKMNWGTLILGIVIGAIVVGVIWMAQKPSTTGAVGAPPNACQTINDTLRCIAGMSQETVSEILNNAGCEKVINTVCSR